MNDALEMWTVTRRPRDLPGVAFAARLQRVMPGGATEITDSLVTGPTLEDVRAQLPPGLACLPRHRDDDPVIVEVWL